MMMLYKLKVGSGKHEQFTGEYATNFKRISFDFTSFYFTAANKTRFGLVWF